jgi:hypothetical protein
VQFALALDLVIGLIPNLAAIVARGATVDVSLVFLVEAFLLWPFVILV